MEHEEWTRAIDAGVAKLEAMVDEMKAVVERQQISIKHLWGADEERRQSIARIKADNAPELGRLPPMSELDEVRCQVWCKQGKWSLRLGITANGRRWKNERNVVLLSSPAFHRSIKKLPRVPESGRWPARRASAADRPCIRRPSLPGSERVAGSGREYDSSMAVSSCRSAPVPRRPRRTRVGVTG
jgi:hypothetical protein